MKVVWKYPVAHVVDPLIELPVGAEVLHFGIQDDELFLWALVDPNAQAEATEMYLRPRFHLDAGAGHPIEEDELRHIGTCFQGPFVWHLFERRVEEDPELANLAALGPGRDEYGSLD